MPKTTKQFLSREHDFISYFMSIRKSRNVSISAVWLNFARVIVGILAACSLHVSHAQTFLGEWKYVERVGAATTPYSAFDVKLREREDGQIEGSYCFVTQNGNRIDCDPDGKSINIMGHIASDGMSAKVHFYSFFGAKDGVTMLSRVGADMAWRVTQNPDGDFFYGPYKVDLERVPNDMHRGERKVVATKAYLYDSPSASPGAKTYVVKGDYVRLLNISEDVKFWKVQYVRSDRVVIERWTDCNAIDSCP